MAYFFVLIGIHFLIVSRAGISRPFCAGSRSRLIPDHDRKTANPSGPILPDMPVSAPSCEVQEYPGRPENSWRVKDGALLSDVSGASAGSVPFGRRAAAANGFGHICLSGPGTRRRTPPPAQRRIVPDRRPCSVLKAPSLSRMARPAPAVPQASGQGSARSETRASPVAGYGALVCAVFGASIHMNKAKRNGRLETCSRA